MYVDKSHHPVSDTISRCMGGEQYPIRLEGLIIITAICCGTRITGAGQAQYPPYLAELNDFVLGLGIVKNILLSYWGSTKLGYICLGDG